jgi:hypothetical protein
MKYDLDLVSDVLTTGLAADDGFAGVHADIVSKLYQK